MEAKQLLLAALLSITCRAYAQQAQGPHTVLAMVLHKGAKAMPEIKVDGVKMNLQAPQMAQQPQATQEPGALVPGPPQVPALTVSVKNLPKAPDMAEALLTVPLEKKKDKTPNEKAVDALKLTKEEKAKLFPCEDYQATCKYYWKVNAHGHSDSCRDVWMQKNCRKSCGLCKVPYGMYIGCVDFEVCKKFAESACSVRWVRETCKHKCGECGYQRLGSSSIFMGKKRHMVGSKMTHSAEEKPQEKKEQLKKVLKTISLTEKDSTKEEKKEVQKVKEDVPKKDKQEDLEKAAEALLQPKVSVEEKVEPKTEETDDKSEGSGNQESAGSGNQEKVVVEKSSKDEDDEDDDDDDKEEDMEKNGEGSSQDTDEDEEESKDTAPEVAKAEDKPAEPIRMDAEPGGEPVVTKLVAEPVKFNQAPNQAMAVKIAQKEHSIVVPKIADKKAEKPKKAKHDKVEKKTKHVKEVKKSDKTTTKTKSAAPKKHKN